MRLGPRRDSDWARRAGAGGGPRGGPLPLDPGLEGRAGPAAARAATAALLLRPGGRPPSPSRASSCPMATCTTAASASAAAAGPRPALPGAADSDGLACPRASARRLCRGSGLPELLRHLGGAGEEGGSRRHCRARQRRPARASVGALAAPGRRQACLCAWTALARGLAALLQRQSGAFRLAALASFVAARRLARRLPG